MKGFIELEYFNGELDVDAYFGKRLIQIKNIVDIDYNDTQFYTMVFYHDYKNVHMIKTLYKYEEIKELIKQSQNEN